MKLKQKSMSQRNCTEQLEDNSKCYLIKSTTYRKSSRHHKPENLVSERRIGTGKVQDVYIIKKSAHKSITIEDKHTLIYNYFENPFGKPPFLSTGDLMLNTESKDAAVIHTVDNVKCIPRIRIEAR